MWETAALPHAVAGTLMAFKPNVFNSRPSLEVLHTCPRTWLPAWTTGNVSLSSEGRPLTSDRPQPVHVTGLQRRRLRQGSARQQALEERHVPGAELGEGQAPHLVPLAGQRHLPEAGRGRVEPAAATRKPRPPRGRPGRLPRLWRPGSAARPPS